MHTELRRGNVNPLTFARPADRQLVWAFGSLKPSIAEFPHLIIENSFEMLAEWCAVIDAKAAPWRTQAAFELNGEPFTRDTYTPEMLHLWDTSENQTLLPTMMNSDLEFPLLLPTRTSPDVLRKMWEHPTNDYYSYIVHLALWIDSLTWAYVPLEYENEFAMLVVGKVQSEWIAEIERRLTLKHKACFSLASANNRFHWAGPVRL